MPRLPIHIDLADYQPLAKEADAAGVTPIEVIQSVWNLGLAAHAQRPRQENTDRLVTDSPLVAA